MPMILADTWVTYDLAIADVLGEGSDGAHDAGGDEADAGTEEDNHDGLDDGCEAVDHRTDLFLIEVSDLHEYGIDLAGFFTDG